MSFWLRSFQKRQACIVKVDRLSNAEGVLKGAGNLTGLKRVVRDARERQIVKHSGSKFSDVVNEGPIVESKCIRGCCCPDTVFVSDLDTICSRVAIDDGMTFRSADARSSLEAVRNGTAKTSLEDLAISEFHKSPGIVSVTEFCKVAVDGLLAHCEHPVDLFPRVRATF